MKTLIKLSLLFTLVLLVACGSDDDASCVEQTWYQDADGDGFGNATVAQNSCVQPAGYVLVSGDCDDADAATYPGATDICGDGIDNNCDSQVDENCVEICDDGIDNDGDGLTDCDDPDCTGDVACPILYADNDGDGYGDPNNTTNGVVPDNTDCDDNDASINPGATEIPDNNVDEDCDASKDFTFYADVDGDGYGDPNSGIIASCPAPCNNEAELTIPVGYVFNNLDCYDSDINVHPFATENTTDGIDNNCDGNTDVVYYYQDLDGDGFGDSNDAGTTVNFAGSATNRADCDDADPSTFPGASEIAGDGNDSNCNGLDEF